ncbi:MAG: nicotinate-nicotinamide nucleotide adenylyltransferase [Clostridium sp.]|jgi:nicotinic acid mononucleotide adenylyltransferase
MSKKQVRQMIEELTAKLCAREFLAASNLSRESVLMLMNREYWEGQLGRIFPIKRRIQCREIYEICREPMSLIGREPRDGWMKFTYQYVCHILYPDEEFSRQAEPYAAGALFYLAVLQFIFDKEREVLPFEPMVDFAFLSEEEALSYESYTEYKKFKNAFYKEYIYEMMRLNAEVTPFRTLEHIAGVHYVAMTVARGLYEAGVPIDLTLTSGAAAGHDLGKFGCKPNERVPYLHYYYTNQWFNRHRMEYTGHIAANHSTWDLEPENLSVESLVLIYADFRVKQSRGEDGREITYISSLDEAFEIILSKLDNVDEAKLNRYRFVYARLHDFETYMRSLGVDVNLDKKPVKTPPMPDISLRNTEQIVDSLIFMGVEHNIDVMHRMGAERQFGNLLEAARSEKNWKNVRAYLNIFQEYFPYTNDIQKEQTLYFLYELLMHKEGDIRTQAARLIGNVIAQFNAGYRKERPADMPDIADQKAIELWKTFLSMIICPDHKLTVQHKRRIGYNLKQVLSSMVEHAASADIEGFLQEFLRWYEAPEKRESGEAFVLLDALHNMPFERCSRENMERMAEFACYYAVPRENSFEGLIIAAWRAFKLITAEVRDEPFCETIAEIVEHEAIAEDDISRTFLQYRILSNLGRNVSRQEEALYGRDVVSDIFLDNLKMATPWVLKAVNIKLLVDQVDHGKKEHILHIAAHLSNLIKVSEYVVVRHDAGRALLRLAPLLTADQRNEIVVELLKGLEVGEYEFSKYIPEYLGQLALWLPPEQLEEVLTYLRGLMANANDRVVSVALDTVGVLTEYYPRYKERFAEDEGTARERLGRLLGMVLGGLANHRETVRQEALLVTGQYMFGSRRLNDHEKMEIFALTHKKLLFLINENKGGELTAFYRAAALSNICRFITAYRLTIGQMEIEERKKVAFFPGTFDPFTLSHKGIVREIRDLGYEVYLAVDEFSWSKKTQPHLIRRQIVNMSVADEFHVNLFPDDIPVNIANPSDLKRLKEVFAGRTVYVVVGSDVIANASSYRKPPEKNSIHSMNHIAFRRVGDRRSDNKYNREMMSLITGELIELELPEYLEDISSTKIRENIDLNRDISNLIDPVVQEYIYFNGLYLREPEYKPILRARAIGFEEKEKLSEEDEAAALEYIFSDEADGRGLLKRLQESDGTFLLLRNTVEDNRLTGLLKMRSVMPEELFKVLGSVSMADMVRRHTLGSILLITGIYAEPDSAIYDPEQLLLTEALAKALEQHCSYAMFLPEEEPGEASQGAVIRQGFAEAENFEGKRRLWLVDMHAPLVLVQNLETTLKEPFSSSPRILRAIHKAHRELQAAMTRLYPGQLVLSLSASVIYHRLVDKITQINQVPGEPTTPRVLGNDMCVPFGKILRGKVVPNTVTKTIHTDKVYEPDLDSYRIEAFPYYSPLRSQVRTIKSFGRPVILVDDLLHKGGRFDALEPYLREEGVEVKKVLLGMISGYGRDAMATRGFEADSIYSIPNLKFWFVESTLYPFIGGDTVRRDTMKVAGLMPSVNIVLPYMVPPLKGCSEESLFELSACCVRNSRDILLALESEYRALFGRNLTLSRLSEAVILPLCPDKGDCINYDPNLAASVYLDNDLEMLHRISQLKNL